MNATKSRGELDAAVQTVSAKAGRALAIDIVTQAGLPQILVNALMGHADTIELLGLLKQALGRITSASPEAPMLCACCPAFLTNGRYSIVIARPACDEPTQGLSFAVCTTCAAGTDAVHAKAAEGLRRIWPDLCEVGVHPNAGRT